MKVFLAALVFVGIAVFGMCFNIIFRKKDFPQFDVGSNDEMRKRGIRCMREEDDERFSGRAEKKDGVCTGVYSDACKGCGLYPFEHKNK